MTNILNVSSLVVARLCVRKTSLSLRSRQRNVVTEDGRVLDCLLLNDIWGSPDAWSYPRRRGDLHTSRKHLKLCWGEAKKQHFDIKPPAMET